MSINKKEEVIDTSDYKLDKSGKKVKAHRIVFNKGEDDGNKGIKEGSMKKLFNQFIEEHTLDLTEEQLNELVAELQEVLGKDAKAGEWISDFVHSDNPKFKGKSKEKRKQMALAAYYAKQRNEEAEIEEELKGNQHKLDKNKNGKLDKHDFKLLRKEEQELEEGQSHQSKTTMKHVANATPGEKKAAKDIKPGIAGYRDRVAMLKSAEARGALKKEEAEIIEEDYCELIEAYDPEDYEATSEKSQFGGHRAILKHKTKGHTSYAGGASYKSAEHAKGEAETYRKHYTSGTGKMTPGANMRHDRAVSEYRKKAKEAGHMHESWDAMLAHVKKTGEASKTSTATKHDVKRTSTGTVYTKQRDADGMSKEFKRDPNEAKRGRGRPKKNKFSEAVEFLMDLSEEQFDEFMEEGFDVFFETYEQLDEISKTTLASYAKKATRSAAVHRKIAADFEHLADKSRKPSMKDSATSLSDKWKAKYRNRLGNIDKAVDRLSK